MTIRFLESLLTLFLTSLLTVFPMQPPRQRCQMPKATATRARAQRVGW